MKRKIVNDLKATARRPLHRQSNKTVALTGGIGSGKTSVAEFLRQQLGGVFISADVVNRRSLLPQGSGWLALREAFGDKFFSNNTVDTTLVRRIIFSDSQSRQQINSVLHPVIREEIHKEINANLAAGISLILIEVPLLFEAAWQKDFDETVVVYARPSVCLERLAIRDGFTQAESQQMVTAQIPSATKALLADHVIDNCGPWSETCLQMLRLCRIIATH